MDEPSAQALDELTAILRQALPEAWRHDTEATITPEGFVFRFRDGEGHPHSFDVRSLEQLPTALVTGKALAYSYTSVEEGLDEAALLDDYRAVLTALSLREDDLLPLMPDPAPPAEAAPLPFRGPLPGERPAPDELVATVRAELPEAWRQGLSVSLTPGGFVLQFVDDAGARHALDAREIRPEAPTLVSGRVLAFSYLFVEGGAEETALAGEYRAVLSRLAAREEALLPWIVSAPPADDGPSGAAPVSTQTAAALPDEQPAPESLVALARDALPEAWRHAVQVTLSPGGFLLRFRDGEGRQHALDARELRLAPEPFVEGRTLGYSYTLVDPSLDEAALLDGYRATLSALAEREDEILPALSLSPELAEGHSTAIIPEATWKGPFPNEKAAPDELVALARGALPAGWRHDLAVSLTPGGFILRFRDDKGMRHAFDAREIRPESPTLVSGRVLAFSYLSLEEGAEATSLAGEYRSALAALAALEDSLLPWLALSPDEAEGHDNAVLTEPSWKGPFPNETAAPGELVAVVNDTLPAAWRHDLAVSLTPDGFIARFRDDQGLRHAFDAREIQPDAPTLVSGRVLAFSYLSLEEGVEETALAGEYRTALAALASREDALLPWLSLPSSRVTARYPDAPANDPILREAAPELVVIVREAIPAAWQRDLDVSLTTHGFVVRFRDPQDAWHVLYVHEIHPDAPAIITGAGLAYGYLVADGERDTPARAETYRPALQALADREERILPWLQADKTARPPSPGLLALVDTLLPAPWRAGVEVVIGVNGFTLGFRDDGGVRHMLEVRELEAGRPSLVRGQQLGFSYRKVDAALEETVMVQRYREALQGFVAREGELVTRMQETA